jgi:hypothetical protein
MLVTMLEIWFIGAAMMVKACHSSVQAVHCNRAVCSNVLFDGASIEHCQES